MLLYFTDNDYAVVKTWITDYEFQTRMFLSDLEAV